MISPARVLQKYLFDHGTIPVWNLYICGGQFELQNPQSFAFTWPSILQYAMQPAAAIMILWLLMTFAGTWATARLLMLAGTRSWIAWTCSLAFSLSGYFGTHFNAGHATFAFFHLVPVLCWVVVAEWRDQFTTGRARTVIPSLVMVSLLLFSAPAIQSMVYALPAFLLVALVMFIPSVDRDSRLSDHAGFVSGVVASCFLGALIASWKLMPVLFQALARQRHDIFSESYSPALLGRTLFTFVARPSSMWNDYTFDGRIYGWWEYGAFVSPALILSAICSPLFVWKVRDFYSSLRRRLLVASLLMMASGAILALGNGFWLDLTHAGRLAGPFAKVLQSVRVFPRFQFLLLFGAALAAGIAIECLANWIHPFGRFLQSKVARAIIMTLVAGPSVTQAAVMIYDIRAIPDRFMESQLDVAGQLEESARTGVPMLGNRVLRMPGLLSAQDFMIRRGALADECYDPFFPVKASFQIRSRDALRPVSTPAVATLQDVTGRSFSLKVPESLDRNLILNLALVDQARVTPQPFIGRGGVEFSRDAVAGRDIAVEFPLDDVWFGVWVSLAAAVTTAVLAGLGRWRGASQDRGRTAG